MNEINERRVPDWLDLRLSTGNILTIVILIGALIAGWYRFQSQVELQARDIAAAKIERERLDARLTRVEQGSGDMRDRLIRVEVQLQNQNDLLRRIADTVGAR